MVLAFTLGNKKLFSDQEVSNLKLTTNLPTTLLTFDVSCTCSAHCTSSFIFVACCSLRDCDHCDYCCWKNAYWATVDRGGAAPVDRLG